MIIILTLKYVISYVASIVYVGAITWLLPIILVLAILSAIGVCTSSLFAASARTIGSLFTMAATSLINVLPRFVRLIVRFWRFMRNNFARIMPNWAATLLAWVILVII